MKVSLGMNLQAGPWGGGNQFGRALATYLERKGVTVCFDLSPPDLDVIVLTEPRAHLRISAYTDREVFRYVRRVNPGAVVVHRVNDCDERKQTSGLNRRLVRANLCADYTVFVSAWLKDLLITQGMPATAWRAILNGSDRTIFHADGYRRWDRRGPLKLVTHHWGAHWMKGFDIYERVDRLVASERYNGRLSFTYIGNLPEGFRFQAAAYVAPTHGHALAAALRTHHVYLTAARNEPGGHHQNEGANCGLPLLYRDSGCLPEYCEGFGVSFTEETLEERLHEMMDTYDSWSDRMKAYPHTAERTSAQYYDLFVELLDRREEILRQRRWWRWPLSLVGSWRG